MMGRKHQPLRTCVACRRARPKRELVRVVRHPEDGVVVDPTGRGSGRGAYLCRERDCWERALSRGALRHALRTELDETSLARLRAVAATIESDTMER